MYSIEGGGTLCEIESFETRGWRRRAKRGRIEGAVTNKCRSYFHIEKEEEKGGREINFIPCFSPQPFKPNEQGGSIISRATGNIIEICSWYAQAEEDKEEQESLLSRQEVGVSKCG